MSAPTSAPAAKRVVIEEVDDEDDEGEPAAAAPAAPPPPVGPWIHLTPEDGFLGFQRWAGIGPGMKSPPCGQQVDLWPGPTPSPAPTLAATPAPVPAGAGRPKAKPASVYETPAVKLEPRPHHCLACVQCI